MGVVRGQIISDDPSRNIDSINFLVFVLGLDVRPTTPNYRLSETDPDLLLKAADPSYPCYVRGADYFVLYKDLLYEIR